MKILNPQKDLLVVGGILSILSIIGIIIFNLTGLYLIHPLLYIITLLMGVGWSFTALGSIKHKR